jgi:quinol-cytochrome oxidoreductase complex cytochrome b subunit
MDSTGIPLEGFTQTQQTLFGIVSAIMTFANPFIVKWIDKKSFLENIPTNFITAFVTVVIAVVAKLVLAPDLSMEATVAVITTMFTGSTIFGRAITRKPK